MRAQGSEKSISKIWNSQTSIYQKFTEEDDHEPDIEFFNVFLHF